MTKLANVSDVRNIIRYGSINEIDVAIDSALEIATSNLAKDLRLDGAFERETRYDLFYVNHREIASNIFQYHWRLSRGFVDSLQTFTIKVADQVADFGTNDTDITSEAIIDYEKGVASIVAGEIATIRVAENNSKIIGNFIRIDYTSGFNSDDTDGYFDPDEVPRWLKEAAAYNAVSILDTIDPNLRSQGDNEMNPKAAERLYWRAIESHVRYFPKHDLPIVKS